jgi:hypothetical protein
MKSFKMINHQVSMRCSIAALDEAFYTPVCSATNDCYSNERRKEPRQDRRAESYFRVIGDEVPFIRPPTTQKRLNHPEASLPPIRQSLSPQLIIASPPQQSLMSEILFGVRRRVHH